MVRVDEIKPFVLLFCLSASAQAQQTVFNAPSPDVLEKGKLYIETDQYFQTWKPDRDDAAFLLVRGVCGIGSNVEVGLNVGPLDYLHRNAPFLDAAVKWRPFQTDLGHGDNKGACGLFLGNHIGVGLRDDQNDRAHDYLYGAAFVVVPEVKTRVSAGPYFVTDDFFGPEQRFGAQLTLEQPISGVNGLTLAADWFSGDGAAATAGFIWAESPFTFYAGYGFANAGRDEDLLTLEIGISL